MGTSTRKVRFICVGAYPAVSFREGRVVINCFIYCHRQTECSAKPGYCLLEEMQKDQRQACHA